MTLAAMMMVALATWSVQDPSLSHATNTPVRNLLGAPGAICADLMMQLLGLASMVLVLPVIVWGCRLIAHRQSGRHWWRVFFWFLGLSLASAFASCLPKTATWPLPTGLGGVIGDALLRVPALIFGPLTGWTLLAVTAVFGAMTLASILIAAGSGWRRREFTRIDENWADEAAGPPDEDAEKASISLGWIAHALLSIRSRLARLFVRKRARALRQMPLAPDGFNQQFNDLNSTALQPDAELDDAEMSEPARRVRARAPARRSSGGFQLPALNLLAAPKPTDRYSPSQQLIDETAVQLESVLGDFGVRGSIINARPGPVVTLYELEPAPGIKSSRVIGLADDIAR